VKNNRGSALIEFCATAVIIVLMAMFCFDAGIMIYAGNILDEAARDAARCAAMTKNAEMATSAANSALSRHQISVPFVGQLTLTGPVQYVTNFSAPYDSISDPNGGPAVIAPVPYVQVNASVTAKMPAPIFIFGGQFATDGIVFNDIATFPLLAEPDTLPLGNFDGELPVWPLQPVIANNYYPCINPKACPPTGIPCVLPPPAPVIPAPPAPAIPVPPQPTAPPG